MNDRAANIFGIHQQRSFWLRCFLGKALLTGLLFVSTRITAHAQISVPAPYRLSHLRGIFVDEKGNPIADAAVTLDRDDKTFYSTTSDSTGRFEIKHVSGHYWLHIKKLGYSPIGRDVIIGVDAAAYLHSANLYIIAGPGACSDDCSAVFTSKAKFEQAIRQNNGHYD
jgi:Carboxypeptidase regulatory-like domain